MFYLHQSTKGVADRILTKMKSWIKRSREEVDALTNSYDEYDIDAIAKEGQIH